MNENLFQERLRELEAAQQELSEVRVGSNMLQRAGAKAIAASKKAAKEREADLAAAAEPKDKITHKDVLVKRGVLKAESVELEESVNDDDYYIVNHDKKHIARRISGKNAKVEFHTDLSKHFKADIDSANKKHGNGHVAIKGMDLKHKGEYSRVTEDVDLTEKKLTPEELKKREEVAKAMERDKPGMDMSKKMAIATAVAKRVAESMQIDELSKSTLGSYVKAAAKDAEQAGRDQEYHGHKNDYTRGEKRQKGVAKAVDRLTKEDVDLVAEGDDRYHGNYDELSRSRQRFHAKPYIPYSSATAKKAPKIDGRHYHKVPFHQKDDAKKEGMRFDSEHKMWYHTSTEKSKASKFSKAE